MKIAGVRFRDNWRVYDFDASDVEVSVGDDVIVDSDRGTGFARVVRLREGEALPDLPQRPVEQKPRDGRRQEPQAPDEEEIEIDVETPGDIAAAAAAAAAAGEAPAGEAPAGEAPAGEAPAEPPDAGERTPEPSPDRPRSARGHRKILRKATADDVQRLEKNRTRAAEAFRACQEMIAEREMPMKLIRAEYSFDASRVTFSFFSENRVDFRELVKDLAHRLHSRIEMRQVGVRDVARMIGGFGPCGRELCCTSFLRTFEPVSIRMAKKQEMVLNPAKISGICGRLLCCLSYEFKMYDDIKKDLAEMKASAAREKRDAEERRLADERRAEEQRRQEQKQRDRQRQQEPRARKEEKKKEAQPDQKQRPPQEQRQREKQQAKQQKPDQAQQQGPQQGQPGEKGEGRNKRKRRFWRKKKKKGGGGGQEGGPPPGGGEKS
jgi:cell fate regulator YaaT (PSP1 superfamily)